MHSLSLGDSGRQRVMNTQCQGTRVLKKEADNELANGSCVIISRDTTKKFLHEVIWYQTVIFEKK